MLAVFAAGFLAVPLSFANGNVQREPGFYLALVLAFTAFMLVGVVIVAHRPGNAVGWIFSAIGLLSAVGVLAMEYAEFAYVTRPGSLPGAALAAWFSWWWLPILGLIFVFTPLFPTGRLPAPPTRRTAPSGPCCSVCWPPAWSPRSSRWCCASAAPLGWSASSSSGSPMPRR
jgi:hypothetical protein